MAEDPVSTLEVVKREIRSILVSCKGNQLTMRQLNNDYKSMMGHDIPFAILGYSTLTSFLNTLKDTVYVKKAPFGGAVVYLVCSNDSAHIQQFVNEQTNGRRSTTKRTDRPPFGSRSNNFNPWQNECVPSPPFMPLPTPNVTQNYFPFASTPVSYPPNPVHTSERQRQSNYQPQLVLAPQVHIWSSFTLNTSLLLQQNVRSMAERNSLLQQIQYEHALNSLKSVPHSYRTQMFSQQSDELKNIIRTNTSHPKRAAIDPPDQIIAASTKMEAPQVTPTAPRCQPEEIPKSKIECEKLLDNSAADTSHSERNFSSLTDLSRGDSCVSVVLSENKNPNDSWSNNLIDDIDAISLSEIEPFHKYTVVALNIRYPAAKLPSKFEKTNLVGGIELVNVCELISPTKFWMHLTSQYDVLTEILDRLDAIYTDDSASELHLKDIDMQEGQLCAVLFKSIWHRGEILSDPDRAKRVKVSLVDYGPTITTHSSNVRALTKDLAAYPIQAFSAYLSNIEPARNDWNTECISKFAEMVSDEFLYARFDELKPGPIFGVELIDTRNEDDVVVNQKLIDLGYAKCK